jgi:substrate import-associated zinc metallohydrolase lipoprotein
MAALLATIGFNACSDDDPDTSISVIKDSQTPLNALARWLLDNYVAPYNVELRYRWEDNETSMDYILVPPTYTNAIRMARLLKYICFDSFDEVTGSSQFIRAHFPKLVHLVGNPGWNTSGGWLAQGSYTLGSSEGGYKINLWYVNHLGDRIIENYVYKDSVIRNREELNSVFFHTIIHEFGHVFHQKVPYSNEFNQISGTDYLGGMWSSSFNSPTDPEIYASGFVSAYASSSANEDFAEIFAYYVCSTTEEFQAILDKAGTSGRALLTSKIELVRNYFAANWNLDLDQLRAAVQKREANLANINFDDISPEATARDYATTPATTEP